MEKMYCAILVCLLTMKIFSQDCVGFKNSDDITDLQKYQLPAWGYHLCDVAFNFNLLQFDRENASSKNEYYNFDARLNPNYTKYYESEQKKSILV